MSESLWKRIKMPETYPVLPCPFCGAPAVWSGKQATIDPEENCKAGLWLKISCDNPKRCPAAPKISADKCMEFRITSEGAIEIKYDSREELAEKWNRRAVIENKTGTANADSESEKE